MPWFTNTRSSTATNAGEETPVLVSANAYYDASVDVVSIRFRDGEPKHVIEGFGNFTIFADEHGVWGIDIEVKRWIGDHEVVVKELSRSGVLVINDK